MSEPHWLGLAIFAGALAMLVTGLVTGRMPNAVLEPIRREQPLLYWSMAGVYAMASVVGLLWGLRALP